MNEIRDVGDVGDRKRRNGVHKTAPAKLPLRTFLTEYCDRVVAVR
jgi:hypothetical protein